MAGHQRSVADIFGYRSETSDDLRGDGDNQTEKNVDITSDDVVVTHQNIPLLLDGKFFQIINSSAGKIEAKCVLCDDVYRGTLRSTSNFLNHLKTKHSTMHESWLEHKRLGLKRPRTSLTSQVNSQQPTGASSVIRQSVNQFSPTQTQSRSGLFQANWQKTADNLVANLIMDAALPIRLVECPAFKKLVTTLSGMPQIVNCPSKYTVGKCIQERFQQMKNLIVEKIKTTSYVCTTADMWTSRRRSYLGMTVHWLNSKYERESYAIACSRVMGRHDYITIARSINDAHQRYGLSAENVVFTVTDNAANMVKSFKEMGIEMTLSTDDDDDEDELSAVDLQDAHGGEDEAVETVVICDLDHADKDLDFSLPSHVRCAAHTLNLIVTADIEKAVEKKQLTKDSFDKTYRQSMNRITQHWNCLKRSNKACELFTTMFGRFVKLPCPTRWNSLHDALSDFVKLDAVKLNEFSTAQKLTPMSSAQLSFTKEFVNVLQPIAISLNRLQGEISITLAELIPCIIQTQHTLEQLKLTELRFCNGLIDIVLGSLRTRFDYATNWSDNKEKSLPFIMATITSPAWKMHWEESESQQQLATDWLIEEIRSIETTNQEAPQSPHNHMQIDRSFYTFMSHVNTPVVQESGPRLQVMKYMCDASSEMASLSQYPLVEKLFYKYNAGIPSSAPVERLFSFAAIILTPKRTRLTDEHFEKLTLLKANKTLNS